MPVTEHPTAAARLICGEQGQVHCDAGNDHVDSDVSIDDGLDRIADATVRYVADVVARRTVDPLDALRGRLVDGTAVEGRQATLEQLSARRVEVLLIHHDPDDGRQAWIDIDPARVSIERTQDTPRPAGLVDSAIQAAVIQAPRCGSSPLRDRRVLPRTSPR